MPERTYPFTMHFPEAVHDELEEIASRDGIQVEDVLRRALATQIAAHNFVENGGSIIVELADGTRAELEP